LAGVEAALRNQLRKLREQDGLSQQQLGEILGVSRQTINAIENERYDPSLPLAFKISRQFKLKIEDIFLAERS
jgi:putative transcriptional regulator